MEFDDGTDSSIGDKYEGEDETLKKKKSEIAPLPTKPISEIPQGFGTLESILGLELEFFLSLEKMRGVSGDMELQMEVFSHSKQSENDLTFEKPQKMRNKPQLL